MKKNLIAFALLGTITLSMFSCEDKKKDEPQLEKKYLLSKVSENDSLVNYTYNSKGLLTKTRSYDKKNKPTGEEIFAYNEKGESLNSTHMNYRTKKEVKREYSYVNGLLKETRETSNGKSLTYTYKYDNEKNTIEIKRDSIFFLLTRDKQGNITNEKRYMITSSPTKERITLRDTYHTYGKTKNPFYGKNMMGEEFTFNFSTNMPKETTSYLTINILGEFATIPFVIKLNYEHNEAGYPTKIKAQSKGNESMMNLEYIEKK